MVVCLSVLMGDIQQEMPEVVIDNMVFTTGSLPGLLQLVAHPLKVPAVVWLSSLFIYSRVSELLKMRP